MLINLKHAATKHLGKSRFGPSDSKIVRERYDLNLHKYVEITERKRREAVEQGRPKRIFEKAISEEEMTEDPIILWLKMIGRKRKEESRRS